MQAMRPYLILLVALTTFSSVPLHLWNIDPFPHYPDPAAVERVTQSLIRPFCRSMQPAFRANLMLSEKPGLRALAQRCTMYWLNASSGDGDV
jgi:hypothetical protein